MSEIVRDKNGKWIGSGNPSGKVKDPNRLILQELCRTGGPEAFYTLMEIIRNPEANTGARVRAIQLLWEYGFGKPTQMIEIKDGREGEKALKDLTSIDIYNMLQLQQKGPEAVVEHLEESVSKPLAEEEKSKGEKVDAKKKGKKLNKEKK